MASAQQQLAALDEERRGREDVSKLYAKKDGGADGETSAVGDEYMRKAAKKKDAFFGGDKRYEKAADLYQKAAAAYKQADNWREAAAALCASAEMQEKLKDRLEAANQYFDAGMCMGRADYEEAVKILEMSISIHEGEARLGAAARVWKALAELQEEEEHKQLAIDAWRKAADCNESEGTLANALQCYLKAAELHVEEYQFKKASKTYEKCAEICVDRNINKGSLRDYLYNALLCQFVVSARKGSLKNLHSMLARFLDIDPKFRGTWQHTLLTQCIEAFEDESPEGIATAAAEQNRRHKLDDRTTQILLEIKKIIQNPPQAEGADEVAEQLV